MKMIGPRVARIMVSLLVAQLVGSAPLIAQTTQTPSTQSSQPANPPRQGPRPPTHADILRGEYGRYRANNDLLIYHLDVRVDPAAKHISGKNLIRFRMLKDDNRIQLDLYDNLNIDKIVLLDQSPKSSIRSPKSKVQGPTSASASGLVDSKADSIAVGRGAETELKYQRDSGAVFVDFPETLKAGRIYDLDFYYSGNPLEVGRFGGIAFRKDSAGRPWINTACEGDGASIWWPNKDQWRDEVESMQISVTIPNDLVDVSNGKFMSKTDLGDGYTRWDWMVHYPINNYDVSMNIGKYEHWSDRLGDV